MIPVALEIQTKRDRSNYQATVAAIARVWGEKPEGKTYEESLQDVLDAVKKDQLAARGSAADVAPAAEPDRHAAAAQKLLDAVFGSEGFQRK